MSSRRRFSLRGAFALLSLGIIGLISAIQVTVQWVLLREDVLEREGLESANTIRDEAYAVLHAEDFADWRNPQSQARFEEFFGRALLDPDIVRVRMYNTEMRIVWSDDEGRPAGTRIHDNPALREALAGRVMVELERVSSPETLFERSFSRLIDLYVPLALSSGRSPGTAVIAGVVEIHKDPKRVIGSLSRGRFFIITTSVAGALVLYVALYGIIHRASRQLASQRADLHAMQAQLRVSERMAAVGEVSAAVAHGIRNPLANIKVSAQVALDTLGEPGSAERHLGAISGEVDRLERWLRALLDVVRPFTPRLATVKLNDLIEELLAILTDRLVGARITVDRELDRYLPGVIADEVQLQQALLGMLDNAVAACRVGDAIMVRTDRTELDGRPGARVTITDTGEGIPADRLARIFEPFFTTKSGGTGLGLSIARKVIEGHGGRITVQSRPGEGTTFDVVLPLDGPAEATS
jgi:signal transduction histidine kinase